ncbi:MAG: aminoglycoside N3''-acetyltransferase, partial [uncultured archaeon A07HR60]
DGSREWIEWEDIDLDDQDFTDCGMAFEREQPDAVNTGRVGVGHAKLLDQPSLVAFGAEWFETTRE